MINIIQKLEDILKSLGNKDKLNEALINNLDSLLKQQEGSRQYPYFDTANPPRCSIGIGRNLTDDGLSLDEVQYLYANDRNAAMKEVDTHLPWASMLSDNRKIVLYNMCFNEGIAGLMKWTNLLGALKNGYYEQAASDILNSLAYKQDTNRYKTLANMIRTG